MLMPNIFHIQIEFALILICKAAKVRRLYDIANVLSSLNLIEKVGSRLHTISNEWNDISGWWLLKFLVTFVSDAASRHKKTCIPVARPGKAKAR
jgi:hypothetical protein